MKRNRGIKKTSETDVCKQVEGKIFDEEKEQKLHVE